MYFKFPNDFFIPIKSVDDLIDDLDKGKLRTKKSEEVKDEVNETIEDDEEIQYEIEVKTRGLQGIDEVTDNEKISELVVNKCNVADQCEITKADVIQEIERKEELSTEEGLKDIKNKRIWQEIDEEYSESQLLK